MKCYSYCHDIECEHLTDDEICSKGLDPNQCLEKDYEKAVDRAYYWKIQNEREKKGLE